MLKFFDASRIGRTVIVAMTLLGWIMLSNHCALGRIAGQARKAHHCCQNGVPKPAQNPADGKQGVECCQSLHVVLPDAGKLADLAPAGEVVALIPVVLCLEARTGERCLSAVATGPPRVASFSELVLHRSLRAHAPPFLA